MNASPTNAALAVAALQQFGFESLGLTVDEFTTPGRVIQLRHEPNRIDRLTSISEVSFDDAWQSRVTGELDGLPVSFIGREALLRNKDAAGRGKDRIDAEELRKLKP